MLNLRTAFAASWLIFTICGGALAAADILELDCEGLLEDTLLTGESTRFEGVETRLAILSQRRMLTDLLKPDAKDNLAAQAPFMVMNAAQRVSVLARSEGFESLKVAGAGRDVTVFNMISAGGAATKGIRVIGQEQSMEAMVENIDAQAMGDRAAASVPLLIGSHGSGKSATQALLKHSFEAATDKIQSPTDLWSFQWYDCAGIPEAVAEQPRLAENGGVLNAALNDSPILLLPEELMDEVVRIATPAVLAMTHGEHEPRPFTILNVQDRKLRDAVLMHYRNKKGSDLTTKETIAVLTKHTRLRRVIWDEASGALPIIDVQGDDVDIAGLFVAPNPVMRVTRGAANAFAWEPSRILLGHGNVVFLDEVLRNPMELLRLFLRVFQDRKVSAGGSPDWPLDTVFITSTNTSSLNALLSDPDNHALIDRFLQLEMPWSTMPKEIEQVLLLNYSHLLMQQRLPNLEAKSEQPGPLERASFRDLFPRNLALGASGSAYRYKLLIKNGDREIKISPHALELMSYIISVTRMETNPAKAKQVMPTSKMPNSAIFQNPITRLRFLEGKMPDITEGEVDDLRRLVGLLDEGANGIASRDGGRWLSRVVAEARRPENRNTISPDLVFKVFLEMLGKKIKTPNNKTRLEWQSLALDVASLLIVPAIKQDITLAMAADQASIQVAYADIFDEMRALMNNPRAITYKSRATQQEKPIDRERLEKVKEIFERSQGKALDVAQIAMFTVSMMETATVDANEIMHPGLVQALSEYYAEVIGRLVSSAAIIRCAQTGEGDTETRSQLNTVVSNMIKLGYDEESARAAIRFSGRIEALSAQAKADKQN